VNEVQAQACNCPDRKVVHRLLGAFISTIRTFKNWQELRWRNKTTMKSKK